MNVNNDFINLKFISLGPSPSVLFSLVVNDKNKIFNIEKIDNFQIKLEQIKKDLSVFLEQNLETITLSNKFVEKKTILAAANEFYLKDVLSLFTSFNVDYEIHSKNDLKITYKKVEDFFSKANSELFKYNTGNGFELCLKYWFESLNLAINLFNRALSERKQMYLKAEQFLKNQQLFYIQVFVNSFDTHDYDINFSSESTKDSDVITFLHGECYKALRTQVIIDVELNLAALRNKFQELFSEMDKITVSSFLCKLDTLFLKKNFLLENKIYYYKYISTYLLDLIEKFKQADKKIHSNLTFVKKQSVSFGLVKDTVITQDEVVSIVLRQILAMNVVEFIKMSEKDLLMLVNKIIKSFFEKIENPVELEFSDIKIPLKTMYIVNDSVNSFIKLWKESFLTKNYGGEFIDDKLKTINFFKLNNKNFVEHFAIYDLAINNSVEKGKISAARSSYTFDIKKYEIKGILNQKWDIQYSFLLEKSYYKE